MSLNKEADYPNRDPVRSSRFLRNVGNIFILYTVLYTQDAAVGNKSFHYALKWRLKYGAILGRNAHLVGNPLRKSAVWYTVKTQVKRYKGTVSI